MEKRRGNCNEMCQNKKVKRERIITIRVQTGWCICNWRGAHSPLTADKQLSRYKAKWLVETGWSPCKWTTRPVAVTLNPSYSTTFIRANPPDPRREPTRDPEPPCLAQQIQRRFYFYFHSPGQTRLSCPSCSRMSILTQWRQQTVQKIGRQDKTSRDIL